MYVSCIPAGIGDNPFRLIAVQIIYCGSNLSRTANSAYSPSAIDTRTHSVRVLAPRIPRSDVGSGQSIFDFVVVVLVVVVVCECMHGEFDTGSTVLYEICSGAVLLTLCSSLCGRRVRERSPKIYRI